MSPHDQPGNPGRMSHSYFVCVCVREWEYSQISSFERESEKRERKRNELVKEKNQVHEQFHPINNTNVTYSWLQYERGHAGVWVSARGQPQ